MLQKFGKKVMNNFGLKVLAVLFSVVCGSFSVSCVGVVGVTGSCDGFSGSLGVVGFSCEFSVGVIFKTS